MAMKPRVFCDVCGGRVGPHQHYVVRIDVLADLEMPAVSSADVEEADYEGKMAELLEEMEGMSEQELMDGVARRFEYKICPCCQVSFLENPLGLPRGKRNRAGEN